MTVNDALAPLNGPVLGLVVILLAILLATILFRFWLQMWKRSSPRSSRLPVHADRLVSHNHAFNRSEPLQFASSKSVQSSPEPAQLTLPSTDELAKPTHTPNARLVTRPGLSPAERRFLEFLNKTVGEEYLIQTKIPLKDIIGRYGWLEKELHTMHKYGQVDFLLSDPKSMHPRLAIELDDKTHNRPDRQDADRRKQELLDRAKLPLVRIRVGDFWGEKERDSILNALADTKLL